MTTDLHRSAAFLLYQTTLLFGILAMPFALVARQLGLTLPIRSLIESAERTYEHADRRRQRR
ncbi:hypothetical protein [Halobellus captivus]|uniref:hypothetical protein n=1 Tax=Halobellus captivus TaxID=2592614 RepID=UPI00193ABC0A|nr:hypothetical protein [Halobellus captivus]